MGDEFHTAKSVAKHNFLSFSQGGRGANKWSLQHKGHMVHSVSSWEQGRAGARIWSQRFHHLNCLVTSDAKEKKKRLSKIP